MTVHHEIAAQLGMTLWTCEAFLPEYTCGQVGQWRIEPGGRLLTDSGYTSGVHLLESLPSLSRRVDAPTHGNDGVWETWMSITPHETESQELAYQHARGEVVIMGLGMGWIAANCALNPEVTRVRIIECDADIIRLYHQCGAHESLPPEARDKISILEADALAWRPDPDDEVDFLYVDIWLALDEPQALEQVRQMQARVAASVVYFWGQELAIASALNDSGVELVGLSNLQLMTSLAEVIALPLLIPADRDYGQMILTVIHNRSERLRTGIISR